MITLRIFSWESYDYTEVTAEAPLKRPTVTLPVPSNPIVSRIRRAGMRGGIIKCRGKKRFVFARKCLQPGFTAFFIISTECRMTR
jgi:hypothetical protein